MAKEAPLKDSDERLLAQAARGDDAALRELLKRHGHKARAVVRGKIPLKYQVALDDDDVMQVAYLEAFLHFGRFEGRTAAAFVSWLQRIAHHVLLDALRGLDSRKRPDPSFRVTAQASCATFLDYLADSRGTPSHDAARDEAHAVVATLLDELPPDYAEVVRQCDIQSRDVQEVAGHMNRSPGAVHMLRARAHLRLRELMGSASKYFSDSA